MAAASCSSDGGGPERMGFTSRPHGLHILDAICEAFDVDPVMWLDGQYVPLR
jgi:hypothetical protein